MQVVRFRSDLGVLVRGEGWWRNDARCFRSRAAGEAWAGLPWERALQMRTQVRKAQRAQGCEVVLLFPGLKGNFFKNVFWKDWS